MFHPFQEDVTALTDAELDQKIQQVTRKYYQIARLGKAELLTQVQTFVTIYKDEFSRRQATRKLETNNGDDLDQLINVD